MYFITMALMGGIVSVAYSGILVSFLTLQVQPRLEHNMESLNQFPGSLGTTSKGEVYKSLLNSENPRIR